MVNERENQLPGRFGRGTPEQPFIRPFLATVTILERDIFLPRRQSASGGERRLLIIGMDEFQERLCLQFGSAPAESPLARRVHTFEVPIKASNAEEVSREGKIAIQFVLQAPAVWK